jgi:hypothetical protein
MQFSPRTVVETGQTYTCEGKLIPCKNGLHASRRIIDALKYAPGPIICRVELSGEIIYDTDKAVARHRKVIWMLDATNVLHEFACRCAEDALALVGNPDPSSIAAIQAKRNWMKGKITDKGLVAARATARDAARDAARDVARAAAWDAAWIAAKDAAWAAAKGAARDAEWAARAAAREAEWDAAWSAARDAEWAARAAARAKFNRRLTSMVVAGQSG